MKKEKFISLKEYNDLKSVIEIRNYINHDFFLTDYQKTYDSYEQMIETFEKIFNEAQFLIFEATDVIDNKIDALSGSSIMRPTIFD